MLARYFIADDVLSISGKLPPFRGRLFFLPHTILWWLPFCSSTSQTSAFIFLTIFWCEILMCAVSSRCWKFEQWQLCVFEVLIANKAKTNVLHWALLLQTLPYSTILCPTPSNNSFLASFQFLLEQHFCCCFRWHQFLHEARKKLNSALMSPLIHEASDWLFGQAGFCRFLFCPFILQDLINFVKISLQQCHVSIHYISRHGMGFLKILRCKARCNKWFLITICNSISSMWFLIGRSEIFLRKGSLIFI